MHKPKGNPKGNPNGRPMSVMAEKYYGPTVGEKLSILSDQLDIAVQALNDVFEYTDDPTIFRLITGAKRHLAHKEESWKEWHKQPKKEKV